MSASPKMSLAILFMLGTAMATSTCGTLKTVYQETQCCSATDKDTVPVPVHIRPNPTDRMSGINPCAGKKSLTSPTMDNQECFENGVRNAAAQSGSDISVDFEGGIDVSVTPIKLPFFKTTMCPVNVHWHLGAEHRSEGQFDEDGTIPERDRRLSGDARYGFACRHYDVDNTNFNTEYPWQFCEGMHVGDTYEVHWPHSAMGSCGTPYQYQTPFYDGVFCGATEDSLNDLLASETVNQDIANAIGVQGQVFTIINDESYFYPDLIRGMIVDSEKNMGVDVTAYTGSTTGTSRDNEVCSFYTPITWQVDRKCHVISASSFDKLCADMIQQRDDMSDDLEPHGARELVLTSLSADNHDFDVEAR